MLQKNIENVVDKIFKTDDRNPILNLEIEGEELYNFYKEKAQQFHCAENIINAPKDIVLNIFEQKINNYFLNVANEQANNDR